MKKYVISVIAVALAIIFVIPASAQTRHRKASAKHSSVRKVKPSVETQAQAEDEEQPSAPGRSRVTTGSNVRALSLAVSVGGAQIPTRAKPTEGRLQRASKSFDGDLRSLSTDPQPDMERPEHDFTPKPLILSGTTTAVTPAAGITDSIAGPTAPVPAPIVTFDGLGRADVGNGYPPDTNGDVGPNHYIQTINTGIGIYDKNTGAALVGPISFNTFMSQGSFGNICDTNNFGDPVVVYDSFEDRWIITDFAFTLDGSGNVTSNSFQCFAVSKTSDPVAGGWYYYFVSSPDGLADYPKFGIWPDGLYMMANMFGKGATSGSFTFSREWAFNKQQMYAGATNPQIVTFDTPRVDPVGGSSVFTTMPSNARVQTGTPPANTPNYFVSTGAYLNALVVWKFHVDWSNVYNSTFTIDSLPSTSPNWASPVSAGVPTQGGNNLDTLATRAMMQNQYTNIGGVESLWLTHTVSNTNTTGVGAAPRWYQLTVTGGTAAASPVQQALHAPDTTVFRWMPSLAVDRLGDMLIGYSASNSSMKPAIRWAGRLAADPASTLPQTETDLIAGAGTQTNNCGGAPCTRWGDYSAMSLDPVDGCTFWYTSEYYAVDGGLYKTRIGSTKFPGCSAVSTGTVSGTVTSSGNPVSGATVNFGARKTTTGAGGIYTFSNIPAGTYPSISATAAGKTTVTNTNVVVPAGSTSTQDFSLAAASASSCLADTTQTDFAQGVPTNLDLTTSTTSLSLSRQVLDQYNVSYGTTGQGFNSTGGWQGQTFTPAISGQLTKADVFLFCSGCSGVPAGITVSVRATSGGLPTGADLASATFGGTINGTAQGYTVTFGSPATLTAGTKYALLIRANSAPTGTGYFAIRSGSSTTGQDIYPGGDRVFSSDSGASWFVTSVGGVANDCAFRTYMSAPSGTLVSGVKDANPATGFTPTWSTLSWTATSGVGQTMNFQVAGSNSPNGPFSFVGPDGTAGTFYSSSGGSLAQFNGKRYLKYEAFLATTNPASSPSLADVTVCYSNLAPTAAGVIISGRVMSAGGGGVRGAAVSITDIHGIQRNAVTNAFGYYMFDNVQSGENYVMRASARRFTFTARTLNVTDSLTDINFVDGQ